MIGQNASLNDGALNLAIAANDVEPAGAAANGADGGVTRLSRATSSTPVPATPVASSPAAGLLLEKTPAAKTPAPKAKLIADAQAMEAHAERRQRLTERLRVENPARSDEEIEELLERFGA